MTWKMPGVSLRSGPRWLRRPGIAAVIPVKKDQKKDHRARGREGGRPCCFTLPLVTRVCVATQAGLGQVLLWDVSALYRKIRGLQRERDTARAQTVAAATAEATALRRLERDIHDGPQQRLVRLAMELVIAAHHILDLMTHGHYLSDHGSLAL
jgi:signal transduction histidine kinase